ncbi:SHOCT domain-containing protein [Kitasatospora cheerisanensis]|uniref:Membrane protein n=1 Tax=Kitasatospora cheerisanensis KCTC 2395 TaxID=1348663 RepID=A0A066YJI8_9ACTN|nr:SHOCT domain-containing protein [Kitasatospora cheerisanensis]KDN81322.1 membrane protein [Kitasatospora cheerisanensis KCTC 2395]
MDDYPLLDLFWTMMWLFLWILWFFLLFKVITDIFRSHDMGGWGKAGWTIFVIVLPYIGVLAYLIARGKSMGNRDRALAAQAEGNFQDYIRKAAGTDQQDAGARHVAELSRLADLKNSGAISEDEFRAAKDRLLA